MRAHRPRHHCVLVLGFAALAYVISSSPGLAQVLPQVPQVFLDTTYAPPGGTIRSVAAGGNLQAALNDAVPGDIIELQAGATYTGTFSLPYKTGTGWIYIRSSAHNSLPPPGTRVSPAQASLMPKLQGAGTNPAIVAARAAHHYRFVGIEITTTHTSTSSTQYTLVLLECSGWTAAPHNCPTAQTQLSEMPTDITFDRSYIHGTSTGNIRRGIAMNGARMAVVDSYMDNFHEVGQEAEAIMSWNGSGPYKIVNNHLEAATQVVFFGGGFSSCVPRIQNLVPADIEIRRNHMFKPLSWQGGSWVVKNIFELKNAQRVLIEGNIFENNWDGSDQHGFAIVFTVRNQDGCQPWVKVQDVTFQNNKVIHAGAGVNILGYDDINPPSGQAARILIKNNLFDDINSVTWGGFGYLYQPRIGAQDVVIDHNTGFQNQNIGRAGGNAAHPTMSGFFFQNNISPHNASGFNGEGTATGTPTLNTYFPSGYVYTKNVMQGGNCGLYPANNFCPSTWSQVQFEDQANGNYRLAPGSPYKNAGTDGKDIGADIDAIEAAIAGSSPGSGPRSPFGGSPFALPGTFQAEDYDDGGEGVAYHDVVPGNAGGQYRTDDVDIKVAGGNGSGYAVNNFQIGEWVSYSIDVGQTGTYRLELNVSSVYTNSQFHIDVDGVNRTGAVLVPNTGSWTTYQWVGVGGIDLSAGSHVLRVSADQEYFDLDAIRATAQTRSPFTGQAPTVPGTFQAEDYDNGGEGIAYHDVVPGNAGGLYRTGESVDIKTAGGNGTNYAVNNFQVGEWVSYSINVAQTGTYRVEANVSSVYTNSQFHIDVDGVKRSGSVLVPNTGSWTTYQWVGSGGIDLSPGIHIVRIYVEQEYFDMDALRVTAQSRSPFTGSAFAVPGTWQAEAFDNGGEGVAYHDVVPGNAGGVYRTGESVDIKVAGGNGTSYAVNNFQIGEWVSFTINVAQAGTYVVEANVSSTYTNSQFHIEIDGEKRTDSVLVPNTGSWTTYQWVGTGGIELTAGTHILRIHVEQEYFDLDALRVP